MKYLLLPALLLSSSSFAASIKTVSVDPRLQTATVVVTADLGFPLATRGFKAMLDCATGKVSTSGFKVTYDGWQADVNDVDNEGNSKMLASKVVQVGTGALSLNGSYERYRFTCKQGVVVTDYSAFKDPKLTGSSSDAGGNVLYWDGGAFDGAKIAIPGYWYFQPFDEKYYSPLIYLEFTEDTLAKAKTLKSIHVATTLEGKEAVFVESADRKTLLPVAYNGGERRFKPMAMGSNGVITVWYAPDYTVETGWQKATYDLKTMTATSVLAPKPKGMTMGQ